MFNLTLTWDRPAKINTQTTKHVLRVGLQPQQKGSIPSLPLRMALALDTSSSMQGQKLQHAKAACQTVISQLRDRDSLFLASYATQVIPLVQAAQGNNTQDAAQAIQNLKANGVTRADLALNWFHTSLPNEANAARVAILITDGHPTNSQGKILPDLNPLIEQAVQLANNGITLCTVGLGDAANFNTAFLTDLSDRGRGAFLYADTPDNLAPQLQQRLTACQAIATQNATLRLYPSPEITLEGFCQLRPEYLPLEETTPNLIPLSALRTDSFTDILIALEIPPASTSDVPTTQPIIQVELNVENTAPITENASILHTQSYSQAQQTNLEVKNDYECWLINTYSAELTRTNDPNKTGELLGNIAVAALKSGQTDIANRAHQQLDDLKKTGKLNAHKTTGLLQSARNLGGQS